MFFTSVKHRGKEVFDSKMIAFKLTHSFRFYIETASILGTDLIANDSDLRYFALLKIMRIFRLEKLIRDTNANVLLKSLMNLVKFIFYLFFYVHFTACALWYIILKNAPK